MNINLKINQLPKTDLEATIDFGSRELANNFAIAYTRKTMMGHTISGGSVNVKNLTEEVKDWIDSYVAGINLSRTNEQILSELGVI